MLLGLFILLSSIFTNAYSAQEKNHGGFNYEELFNHAHSKLAYTPSKDPLTSLYSLIPSELDGLLPIKSKSNWDWIQTFEILGQALAKAINGSASTNVSINCLKDFEYYVQAQMIFIGASLQSCDKTDIPCFEKKYILQGSTYFAAQVLDSTGKIGAGFFDGNYHWWGKYDECKSIHSRTPSGKFNGEFCLLKVPLGLNIAGKSASVKLEIGTCFPDTCSDSDLHRLLQYVGNDLGISGPSSKFEIECRPDTDPLLDPKAVAFIVFSCVWGIIMLIGTCYDYFWIRRPFSDDEDETREKQVSFRQKNQNWARLLLLSFSLIANGEKILTLEKGKDTITCLHGMRFLSMAWVILGHTYVLSAGAVDNILSIQRQLPFQILFQGVGNATLSVDTFFLLSGFLLSYLWFKEASKTGGRSVKSFVSWILFYVHRYLRLTPVYAIIIFYEICIFTYTTNGPMWPRGAHDPACEASWYYNLLYVNNFFNLDKQCLGHTWYLANDMQFHWVSPIILVSLYFFAPAGFTIGLVGIGVQVILFGYYNAVNNYGPSMENVNTHFNQTGFYMGKHTNPFNQMYIKPYMRIGPYIVGLLLGYFLRNVGDKPKRMKFWFKFLMRFVTIGLNCLIIYGVFDYVKGKPMPAIVNGFYSGTRRTVWAINLSWIIFECMTKNGGVIDKFLSLRVWLPLSRLTYCAYLLHPLVIYLYCYGQQVPIHYSNELTTIYLFFGHLLFSYLLALIFSVSFEAPFLNLEKLLINGIKNAFVPPAIEFSQAATAQVSPESGSPNVLSVESLSNDRSEGSEEKLTD